MATINLRTSDENVAEIDRRASMHGYPNRTAFLLGLALADELETTADEARLKALDERIARLEYAAFAVGPA